jgi:hypothetical protein
VCSSSQAVVYPSSVVSEPLNGVTDTNTTTHGTERRLALQCAGKASLGDGSSPAVTAGRKARSAQPVASRLRPPKTGLNDALASLGGNHAFRKNVWPNY